MFLHDFSERKIKAKSLCRPHECILTSVIHRKESPLKHKGFVARALSVVGSEQLVKPVFPKHIVGYVAAFVLFAEPMLSERKGSFFETESHIHIAVEL